jgi:hypothetical protein
VACWELADGAEVQTDQAKLNGAPPLRAPRRPQGLSLSKRRDEMVVYVLIEMLSGIIEQVRTIAEEEKADEAYSELLAKYGLTPDDDQGHGQAEVFCYCVELE